MKLYLAAGRQSLNGYVHVDANPIDNNLKYIGKFYDLSQFAYYGEVEEIIAENIIDSLDLDERKKAVQHWYDLLAPGGTIKVIGMDIIELAKSLLMDELSLHDLNVLIFQRKSISECNDVAEHLKSLGFKITRQRLEQHQFLIEAVK